MCFRLTLSRATFVGTLRDYIRRYIVLPLLCVTQQLGKWCPIAHGAWAIRAWCVDRMRTMDEQATMQQRQ